MNIAKTLELEKTKTINGEYNGTAFSFDVKTNAVTPQFMQRIADVQTRPIELANGLADVITAWDIDLNGRKFPPTAGNLSILPIDFLEYLLGHVADIIKSDNTDKNNRSAATNG